MIDSFSNGSALKRLPKVHRGAPGSNCGHRKERENMVRKTLRARNCSELYVELLPSSPLFPSPSFVSPTPPIISLAPGPRKRERFHEHERAETERLRTGVEAIVETSNLGEEFAHMINCGGRIILLLRPKLQKLTASLSLIEVK